jgi:hypothetical protein
MKMQIDVDNYRFDFVDVIEAYKFDEPDNLSPHYHGVTQLKAVDVMVELSNKYLFIEIKTFDDETLSSLRATDEHKTWLKNNLKTKYRDTFLYRYCEGKLKKPITYICLLNFDSILLSHFRKILKKEIPEGNQNKNRWKKTILDKLLVVDANAWNRNLQEYGTCTYIA